ncbi:hypothetical protein L1987_00428 [Smallanthus sonchifolius]|uniref:Uncharacterized protein n=1 Tax=Smallanthus sonchifolius TaxID=185202 RepID=A0ACB9K242_9ASTR|nr:hypothetical protein L1987_00428 [Smallanthus sonchifolius]
MVFFLRSHLRRELFSIYNHRSQLFYSTATKTSPIDESPSAIRTEFEDYLIKTLGFSKESAISSSSKMYSVASERVIAYNTDHQVFKSRMM